MSAGDPEDRVTRIERQLAVAQQITHIGSWEFDAATGVVLWSDELYRIYGLEPRSREITFAFFVSMLHPDDRPRIERQVGRALEHGGRFGYPERIVRPDGSVRHLDTVGEAVTDADGRVLGLIGTCRDVTEERRRDEALQLYADIFQNVQIGLGVWEYADPEDPRTLRLVASNPAADGVARTPLGPWIGRALPDIVPYAKGGELERILTGVARDRCVREATVLRSRDARDPNRALAMKAFPLPGRRVGVAIDDITEETKARHRDAAEQRIFERIASGEPLDDVLAAITRMIEDLCPPTIASILLLDADGLHVRHGAAPNLPESYRRAIDGAPIGPSAGSCGTAAYRRAAVFVRDIDVDPVWDDYRELARAHGLRACWSTPILATEGRVLGTFALYYREPRDPTEVELALIGRATHIARIAIERRQLEDQLRALSAHVESVREEERSAIARAIHDELGQALTALKLDIAWVERRVLGDATLPRDAVLEKLRSMSAMTDELIDHVRRISSELRPGVLDDLGLSAALEWQAQEFESRTGTPCVVRARISEPPVGREVSTLVFRIFQEALTNVARHADASLVEARLEHDAGAIHLEVRDDGRGIDPDAIHSPTSLGLLGMRERARRLGGTAHVAALPTGGTLVSLVVPLAGAEDAS